MNEQSSSIPYKHAKALSQPPVANENYINAKHKCKIPNDMRTRKKVAKEPVKKRQQQ